MKKTTIKRAAHGGKTLPDVTGEIHTVMGFELVLYREPESVRNRYAISELYSGMKVCDECITKKEAISVARRIFKSQTPENLIGIRKKICDYPIN